MSEQKKSEQEVRELALRGLVPLPGMAGHVRLISAAQHRVRMTRHAEGWRVDGAAGTSPVWVAHAMVEWWR